MRACAGKCALLGLSAWSMLPASAMNPQVKLGLYVVTLIGTLVFGTLFLKAWKRADGLQQATSSQGSVTNAVGGTNQASAEAAAAEVTPEREAVPEDAAPVVRGRGFGRIILWGLLATVSLVGLGALAAYDVSQYAGNRATTSLFDDEGEDVTATDYELVEKAYGEGDYLEAVRLLREYLKGHPKAVHAQIRIAEIYEKDLNNPLASALEYEEVLQRPLEPERKGWTAIHLVNLYNRMDKPDQAIAWLKRVIVECRDTPAAAKARERLEAAGIGFEEPPPPAPEASTSSDASSGLPPGFRPK